MCVGCSGAELGVAAPDKETVGRFPARLVGAGARAQHERGVHARTDQLCRVSGRLRSYQLPAATQRQVS